MFGVLLGSLQHAGVLSTQLCAASKPDSEGDGHRLRLTVAPPLNVASTAALVRDAPRSGHEPGIKAVTADVAMDSAMGPAFLLCYTVIGLLLRLRPNHWGAFGLGVALHGWSSLSCRPLFLQTLHSPQNVLVVVPPPFLTKLIRAKNVNDSATTSKQSVTCHAAAEVAGARMPAGCPRHAWSQNEPNAPPQGGPPSRGSVEGTRKRGRTAGPPCHWPRSRPVGEACGPTPNSTSQNRARALRRVERLMPATALDQTKARHWLPGAWCECRPVVRAAAEAAERRARKHSRGRRCGEDGALGAAPGMQGSRGAGRRVGAK